MKKRIVAVLIFLSLLYVYMGQRYLFVNANQSLQYEYDSLGRVTVIVYPDGTEIKYVYDCNGNLLSNSVSNNSKTTEITDTEETDHSTTEENATSDNLQPEQTSENGYTDTIMEENSQTEAEKNENQNQLTIKRPEINARHDTEEDKKNYKDFREKKPVIKSLKLIKRKGKRYLKIRIRKTEKKEELVETGYQIQYATNSKFKRAKYVTVTKKNKKLVTVKTWKVKKKKAYYVRVRAYMKTKTGKKIYTRYSKKKRIKI